MSLRDDMPDDLSPLPSTGCGRCGAGIRSNKMKNARKYDITEGCLLELPYRWENKAKKRCNNDRLCVGCFVENSKLVKKMKENEQDQKEKEIRNKKRNEKDAARLKIKFKKVQQELEALKKLQKTRQPLTFRQKVSDWLNSSPLNHKWVLLHESDSNLDLWDLILVTVVNGSIHFTFKLITQTGEFQLETSGRKFTNSRFNINNSKGSDTRKYCLETTIHTFEQFQTILKQIDALNICRGIPSTSFMPAVFRSDPENKKAKYGENNGAIHSKSCQIFHQTSRSKKNYSLPCEALSVAHSHAKYNQRRAISERITDCLESEEDALATITPALTTFKVKDVLRDMVDMAEEDEFNKPRKYEEKHIVFYEKLRDVISNASYASLARSQLIPCANPVTIERRLPIGRVDDGLNENNIKALNEALDHRFDRLLEKEWFQVLLKKYREEKNMSEKTAKKKIKKIFRESLSVSVDEVSVSSKIIWKSNQIIGLTGAASKDPHLKLDITNPAQHLAKSAMLFIVRSNFDSNFTHPLCISAMGKTTQTEVEEEWTNIVQKLIDSKFRVQLWIADAALCHRYPAKKLKELFNVDWLPDPPHVLKRLRNWLFSVIGSDEGEGVPFLDGTRVSKSVIELAYLRAMGECFSFSPWISYQAIYPDAFSKMRVGLVLRILEPRFIEIVRSINHPQARGTSQFLEMFANWWSIFGCRSRVKDVSSWENICKDIKDLNSLIDEWALLLKAYQPTKKSPAPCPKLIHDLREVGSIWIEKFTPIFKKNIMVPGFCFRPGAFTQDVNEGIFGKWRSRIRGDGGDLSIEDCRVNISRDIRSAVSSSYIRTNHQDEGSHLGSANKGSYARGKKRANCSDFEIVTPQKGPKEAHIAEIQPKLWQVSNVEKALYVNTILPEIKLFPSQLIVAHYIAGAAVRSVAMRLSLEDFIYYDIPTRNFADLSSEDQIRATILRHMLVSNTIEAPIIYGAQQTIFDLVEKKKNTLIRVNALIFWSLFAKIAQCLAAERKSGFIAANRRSVVVPLLENSSLEKEFTNALELTHIPMNEHTPKFREISDDIRRRSIAFFESKFTGGETVRNFNDCLTKTEKLKRKEKKEKKRSKNRDHQSRISEEQTIVDFPCFDDDFDDPDYFPADQGEEVDLSFIDKSTAKKPRRSSQAGPSSLSLRSSIKRSMRK